MDNLARRKGPLTDAMLGQWFESIFCGGSAADILDLRPREQKQRLFDYKEATWTKFGYTPAYLKSMQSQSFWDAEYAKTREVDAALEKARGEAAAAR